jgi:signal transduction histidine kinase/PAS domain-containing protein
VLIRFSNPSMGIEGADRESDASFERVFRGIPVPVVVLDSRGVIAGANEAARILWRDTLGREAESSLFFESLSDEDRPRVTALHQKIASSGSTTPVSLRAGLCSTDGRIIPAEMTAARFTETGDAVAAVVPSAFPDAADAGIGQTVSALLAALETRPSDEDLFRWVLELVRAGTGARGASCRLEGRTITVGDIQLEEDEGIDGGEEGESGQDEDSRSFTVPVKHRQGLLSLRLSGLSPDELAPGQDLVIRLASLFVDYAYGMESVDRITKTFSSIRDFWSLVSQQNGGLEGILKRMADVSSSDAVLVSGLREGESGLVPVAGFGYAGDLPVLSLEADTVATWAYTHGELTYMADSVRDSRFEAVCPGAGSEMAVPLLREGRTVGTLTASSRHRGGYSKPLPLVLSMMGTVISLWLYGGAGGADHRGSAGRRGGSMDRARTDSLLMALAQRLRSPMAAMAANAELMASGGVGELSGEQMECVESMTRSLDDLHDQCERLLTFIRLELHEATGEPIWADPAGLVATILPGLEKRAGTRKVSLKIDMPAEPFLACFDPSCMEQIVANLVDNAISFNMPGGEVLLRISLEGDIWTLEVSDTGRGIPPEELPGIFDGFRPGSGMPGHGTGLGIGLAIVKRFTELLGGIVSVWSSEKTGSRFVLRFPLSG